MPQYQWVGIDLQGQTRTGNTFCASPAVLEKFLFEHDIALISARPARQRLWQRWRHADSLMFLKQLEILLGAGVFLANALNIILGSTRNASVKQVMEHIKAEVEQGSSLSKALELFPDHFNTTTLSMICAGEESGSLVPALHALTNHYEFTQVLYRRLRAAALLPGITFFIFLLIAGVIMGVIIPQFATLFFESNQQLPLLTRSIIRISTALTEPLTIGSFGVVAALLVALRARAKAVLMSASMVLPLFSRLVVHTSLMFFLETLGLLLQGGVPLINALRIAKEAVTTAVMQEQISLIIEAVGNGRSLSSALREQSSQFFPQDLIALITVGEESGKLSTMVMRCAKMYEEKVGKTLDLFASILQPLLMIFLGLVVALLIAAVYVPIFEISNTVTGPY